jgi:hypothetical protein
VKSSASYLHSMQAILETPVQNIVLEEVEVSDDAEHWLIALGYDHLLRSSRGIMALSDGGFKRKYKRFKVDRENGEVEYMKNVSI